MSVSVDVVVPTFGGWELTSSCLRHLRDQTWPHAVIVVDNSSPDGSAERLRTEFPEARLEELADNLGFPIACNRGVAAGTSDVVVLLNNDVDCPPEFLERLVAPLAADPTLGSAAAVLVRPDMRTIDSVGLTADSTLAGFPRLRGRPVEDAGEAAPVLSGPSGAAGAYRRVAWDDVGGLDEGVFMYGEDIELALRLQVAGWRTTLVRDAVAVHHGSATAGHRTAFSRYHGGFARGYFGRRYGLLRSKAASRAAMTEAIVVVGDALLSGDVAAVRGRIAGWRAASGLARKPPPPSDAVDSTIGFIESLRLRRATSAGERPSPASRRRCVAAVDARSPRRRDRPCSRRDRDR